MALVDRKMVGYRLSPLDRAFSSARGTNHCSMTACALTSTMRKIQERAAGAGERVRDLMRGVRKIVMRIGRSVPL